MRSRDAVAFGSPLNGRLQSSFQWPLVPRDRHGRFLAMPVAAAILGSILEPRHEADKLLDRLLVGLPALLGGRELRLTQDSGLGIAARPGNDGRRPRGEEVDPVERALLLVEADG